MEGDRQFHVIKVGLFLDRVNSNEKHGEQVEDYSMVDRAHSALERTECEEFLSGPDPVNAIGVFDFFLLDSMFVELCGDLVSENVRKQLDIVEACHEVAATHEALENPVVDLAIFMAVDESYCVSLRPELACCWVRHVEEKRHENDLHPPEVKTVDVAARCIHELQSVSERFLAGEYKTNNCQE